MELFIDPSKLTDSELIEQLCSSKDDVLLYGEFVKRFNSDLQKECERICKNRKLDLHIGRQIAHDTFARLRKYKSFKTDEIKLVDRHRAILVYLTRISTRLFSDHHRNQKVETVIHKTYFEDILDSIEMPEEDVSRLKQIKEITVQIFRKLNAKEQKIILTDIDYKRHHKYLPDDIIESLAEEFGVKSDSIRKIRERAISKIKNAINEINEQ
jgi:DNA-directed RNA polymerase specialized sigma24 family protein